jgi:O-acetyl-ADP-ribose deacetylase (regulator of RNase III)
MKVIICTLSKNTQEVFKKVFENESNVEIFHGSCFNVIGDVLVTPGNGFGIMDGGFDKEVIEHFGHSIETKVINNITENFDGELMVGESFMLELNKKFKYLCYATTMRVPKDVSRTVNAYYSFRSALRSIKNATDSNSIIVTPTFCTGYGKMNDEIAAIQMLIAYRNIIKGVKITDYDKIYASDSVLLTGIN